MQPTFKTEMLIYQSKGNLDEKNLFGKITHHLDPEIRKMQVNGIYGNKNSIFHFLVHDLLSIEIRILHLKLAM